MSCPNWLLALIIAMPVVICVVCSMFVFQQPGDAHNISCTMIFSLALTETVTSSLKQYVGRFRPNFYQMCGFDTTTLTCTSPQSLINEGRSSFPSGHSSMSICSMALLSMFFLEKAPLILNCSVFKPMINCAPFKRAIFFIALTPYIIALWVCASRLHDMWHHPSDVLAGGLIGFVSAYVSFFSWYPSIRDRNGISVSPSDTAREEDDAVAA